MGLSGNSHRALYANLIGALPYVCGGCFTMIRNDVQYETEWHWLMLDRREEPGRPGLASEVGARGCPAVLPTHFRTRGQCEE